jgi:FMN-dependent NADH-azoreductase
MSKVLYIKANPKSDEISNTFKLANTFLEEYKRNNPNDEIIELDLYKENIRPLDGEMVEGIFEGVDNEVKRHAKLFAGCDKYIFAAPMWNLSIPSILKAYFDYVSYVGITFKYSENGPIGLLADKPRKAMHIVTRGGMYSQGPGKEFELGDKYIRTILGFFGIYDIKTLALENTNVLQEEELQKAIDKAHNESRELAKEF